MNAAATTFMTPRPATLVLRGSRDPSRQATVQAGDPLLITEHLSEGFVEVDWRGERWFAQQSDLAPWAGTGGPAAPAARGAVPAAPAWQPRPAATPWPATGQPAGAPYQQGYGLGAGRVPLQLGSPATLVPIFVALCAVASAIGSIGTWATVFSVFQVKGLDNGDGKVTLGLAIAAVVFAILRVTLPQVRFWFIVVALLLLGVCTAVGAYDWIDITRRFGAGSGVVDVGWGLIAMTVASALGVALCVASLIQDGTRGRPAARPY